MKRTIVILLVALVGLTACSGDTKVGDESLLDLKKGKANCRLGECESPSPRPTKKERRERPRDEPTHEPTKTAQPAPTVAVWTVKITANGFEGVDAKGNPFNALNFNICKGDELRFTNADSQARGATADGNRFDTGALGPGKSFVWTSKKVESFNFTDHDRPFVVGKVNVVAC